MSIDDALRELLDDAITEPRIDADAVTSQLLARLGQAGGGADAGTGTPGDSGSGGGMPPWLATGLPTALAVVAGVFVGWAGSAFGGDDPPTGAALASVPVYACPGAGEMGQLYAGDRAFIVGQSEGFLAVRNTRGDGDIVYVASQHITPDSDVSGLPEMGCETDGVVTALEPTPSPEPSPAPSPAAEPTTPEPDQPQPQPAPKPQPQPEPEPAPQDTQKPVISNASASPGTVSEAGCPVTTSTISASVSDNVGVTQVTAAWTFGGQNYSTTMSGGGSYTATFGPMPAGHVSGAPFYQDVTITITAKDAAGNQRTDQSVTVRVEYCLI